MKRTATPAALPPWEFLFWYENVCATAGYFAVNAHILLAKSLLTLAALTFRRTDLRRKPAPPHPLKNPGFIAVSTIKPRLFCHQPASEP
jgi:quinol-cytochrome oxidoreductase complex cytochrome b subunit